jgi:hypothetical protein
MSILAKYLHVPEGDAGGWVTYRPFLVRALIWAYGEVNIDVHKVCVLELGTGVGSSPMLAALAVAGEFFVTAVESDPKWFAETRPLAEGNPNYDLLSALEPADLALIHADVAFVDHGPVEARARDLAILAKNPNVGLVVVHDWNVDVYGYDKSIFKHRIEDCGRFPNTAILSNTVDLSDWLGYEK